MSQGDQADLAKKSRELAEKERVLNARENILEREKALQQRQKVFDDAETKLDVLRKQITAEESILEARRQEVDDLADKAQITLDSLKAQEQVVRQSITTQNDKLDELKTKETQVNASIRNKRQELADLKEQVRETKEYREEQEKLSENTISEWNITLQEFRKEADNIQLEKNKLSADIIRLGQDKLMLVEEVRKIEAKMNVLEDGYESKVEEFKDKLRGLDKRLDEKIVELDNLKNAQSMREQALDAKERSVRIKESAFVKRDLELNQKEQRLRGAYGLAGIDYENDV